MESLCRDHFPLYFHITLSCIERIKRAVVCIQVQRGKKKCDSGWLCLLQQALPLPHRPGLRSSLAPLCSVHFHKGLFPATMRRHLTSCLSQLVNHFKLVGMRKGREELFSLALCPADVKDTFAFCPEHKADPVQLWNVKEVWRKASRAGGKQNEEDC